MERVYVNQSIRIRMWFAIAAVGAVVALAVWVLLARPRPDTGGETADPLIVGAILVAIAALGAIRFGSYGLKTVTAFDVDHRTGDARVHFWRALGEEVVDTHVDRIVEWRYEIGRQRTRMPMRRFRARIEFPHRWLIFELSPMMILDPVFARMAPEAVDEFERETGRVLPEE